MKVQEERQTLCYADVAGQTERWEVEQKSSFERKGYWEVRGCLCMVEVVGLVGWLFEQRSQKLYSNYSPSFRLVGKLQDEECFEMTKKAKLLDVESNSE
jgi:hypothetical protein